MGESGVVGVVLGGGGSRRMGRDKAVVPVDGVPMGRRVADALLAGGAASVVLVGGQPGWGPLLGLDLVADRHPGIGPLGGLATALAHGSDVGADVVVLAPCDQPWLDGATVERLLTVGSGRSAPVIVRPAAVQGRRQPLPSVWPVDLASTIEATAVAGERRLEAAFVLAAAAGVGVVEVEVAAAALRDVDRPEDLTAPSSG